MQNAGSHMRSVCVCVCVCMCERCWFDYPAANFSLPAVREMATTLCMRARVPTVAGAGVQQVVVAGGVLHVEVRVRELDELGVEPCSMRT